VPARERRLCAVQALSFPITLFASVAWLNKSIEASKIYSLVLFVPSIEKLYSLSLPGQSPRKALSESVPLTQANFACFFSSKLTKTTLLFLS
jgi:hypothetical protein